MNLLLLKRIKKIIPFKLIFVKCEIIEYQEKPLNSIVEASHSSMFELR